MRKDSKVEKENFGSWVKERRTSLGLSQASLAVKLAVSQAAVSAWEKGYKYPSDLKLKNVVKFMGSEDFMTRESLYSVEASFEISLDVLSRISKALNRKGERRLKFSRILSIYKYVEDVEGKLGKQLTEEQMSRFVADA